jgi:hypothetical protein
VLLGVGPQVRRGVAAVGRQELGAGHVQDGGGGGAVDDPDRPGNRPRLVVVAEVDGDDVGR